MTDDTEQSEAFARYIAGESDEAERAHVRTLLAADSTLAREHDRLLPALGRLQAAAPEDVDVEKALILVRSRLDAADVLPIAPTIGGIGASTTLRRPPWSRPGIRAAAGLVLAAGALGLYQATRPAPTPIAFQTAVGQIDTVALPDGSSVIMAPATKLTVDAFYGKKDRSVRVDGMAFFTVEHNAARPFRVRAGDALVEDLGTEFTVRADGDGAVDVSVKSGVVRLQSAAATGDSGIVLNQGESGVFADRVAARYPAGTTQEGTEWLSGSLVFNAASMNRVSADLQRWYGIRLVLSDSSLSARRLTAQFENESVDEIINILSMALDAVASRRADTIVLSPAR